MTVALTTGVVITPADGEAAHLLNQEIQEHLIAGERSFLRAGRKLCQMQDTGLYLALEGRFETFEDYAKSERVKMAEGSVYRLMRAARRCARLEQRAREEPGILQSVAEDAGISVSVGTVTLLAERAVLDMGLAKAEIALRHVLDEPDVDKARELVDKARELTEVHLVQEVARYRRGGADDPVADYLIGVKRQGMAMFGEMVKLRGADLERHLGQINMLLVQTRGWLTEYATEGSHRGQGDRPTDDRRLGAGDPEPS